MALKFRKFCAGRDCGLGLGLATCTVWRLVAASAVVIAAHARMIANAVPPMAASLLDPMSNVISIAMNKRKRAFP